MVANHAKILVKLLTMTSKSTLGCIFAINDELIKNLSSQIYVSYETNSFYKTSRDDGVA